MQGQGLLQGGRPGLQSKELMQGQGRLPYRRKESTRQDRQLVRLQQLFPGAGAPCRPLNFFR